MQKRFPIRFLVLLGVLASAFFWPMPARADILQIITETGKAHAFQVEIADSPDKQRRGLMHVAALPPQNGMLFPMQPPRIARFWMRNTLIPLDMIFIAPGGVISEIVTRRDTQSDTPTVSPAKVSAVLELNAGEAARLGIGIGDKVIMSGVAF